MGFRTLPHPSHTALHGPLSHQPYLCTPSNLPHFKLVIPLNLRACPAEKHAAIQKKRPRQAGRKVSPPRSNSEPHGLAALGVLRSKLQERTSGVEIASSSGADRKAGGERCRMRECEEKAPLPTQACFKLADPHQFSRTYDNSAQLGPFMLSNAAPRAHVRPLHVSERRSKPGQPSKESVLREAGRSHDAKALPETDGMARDDSTGFGSPTSNDAANGAGGEGGQSLSGRDVLLVLRKAALDNAKKKKGKRKRCFAAEKAEKNAEIASPAVGSAHIKPIVVRAEWALQIEELEKALVELEVGLA